MCKLCNAAQARLDILIVNRDDTIIHPQKASVDLMLPASLNAKLHFSQDVWGDGVSYISSTVPVMDGTPERTMGWRIVVRQPVEEAFYDLRGIQRVLLVTAVISGTIFLALVWWGAVLISRPLKELAAHARSIEQRNTGTYRG